MEDLQGPVIEKVASKVAEKKVGKVAAKPEEKVEQVAEKAHDAAEKVTDVVKPGRALTAPHGVTGGSCGRRSPRRLP